MILIQTILISNRYNLRNEIIFDLKDFGRYYCINDKYTLQIQIILFNVNNNIIFVT